MTFGQFFSILKARRWLALIVFSVIVVVGVVGSLLWPKQYLATASVVVDGKPDPLAVMGYPSAGLAGFLSTQVDIINSDRVALRVIRDLKLLDNPQIREQWQIDGEGKGTIEQWLVDLLKKQLLVTASKDSNVLQVGYQSADPRFSAAVANAFVQAYITTTLELRVDPAKQFSGFFASQSKDARDSLEKAQSRLSAFQRDKGIIAADERLDVENARLNELSSQLVQIQAISSESGSRQVQAQGAQSDRIQEVLNNPLISGLKADLTRSEARFQELSSKFGENHPQVIEARASIAELRSRVDSETRRVSGGVGVTNTINKQREAQVRRELDVQRSKLLELKAVRDQGAVLVREVENAQRMYDSVMQRLSQTAMQAQATQSYANVLTSAEPPAQPASPKLLLNTALAIFLGALIAIGGVLLMELSDRRVRDAEDIVAALGLPVLGILPKPNSKRFAAGRHALLMQQRVIGLPAPTASKAA